jgi:hypothetical protein
MIRMARMIEALHNSRQRQADRVIRRHWHLVEEAHQYDRRREIEAASSNAGRPSQRSFTTAAPLCSPEI